jgi:dephospho-CoA kinase
MTEQDARARMAAQATREKRLEIADVVIDNDVPLEELRHRVGDVWADLVRRARAAQGTDAADSPDPPRASQE